MPAFKFAKGKHSLAYTAADLSLLDRAAALVGVMLAHDADVKQDATTCQNSLHHLISHIEGKRKAAEKPEVK